MLVLFGFRARQVRFGSPNSDPKRRHRRRHSVTAVTTSHSGRTGGFFYKTCKGLFWFKNADQRKKITSFMHRMTKKSLDTFKSVSSNLPCNLEAKTLAQHSDLSPPVLGTCSKSDWQHVKKSASCVLDRFLTQSLPILFSIPSSNFLFQKSEA